MGRLGNMGFGFEAGLLRPARPLAAEPGMIRLGYATDQEPIRRRAAGSSAGRIAKAMEALARGQVRCEFVSTGEAAPAGATPPKAITSEQARQAAADPAVQAVMDLFGGEIQDIRPNPSAPIPTDEAAEAGE